MWCRDRCLATSFIWFRQGERKVGAPSPHRREDGRIVEPVLLRIQEAAKLLKVSKWTIYRWVEEGRLRGTKIGKSSLRIFHESIAGLIRENQVDMAGTLPPENHSRMH
jgi:excisionase family DNA binding protein